MYTHNVFTRSDLSGEKATLPVCVWKTRRPDARLNSLNEEGLIYITLSLVRASSVTRGLNSTDVPRRRRRHVVVVVVVVRQKVVDRESVSGRRYVLRKRRKQAQRH